MCLEGVEGGPGINQSTYVYTSRTLLESKGRSHQKNAISFGHFLNEGRGAVQIEFIKKIIFTQF